MKKNNGVLSIVFTLAMLIVGAAQAQSACQNLFGGKRVAYKYATNEAEVAALYEAFPAYKLKIDQTVQNIMQTALNEVQPITKVADMKQVRSSSNTHDFANKQNLETLDPVITQQILDVHNLFLNKEALAKYITHFMNEVGVMMMKTKDDLVTQTNKLSTFDSTIASNKVPKENFLRDGQMDHQSLMKVLVNRIRARGDKMTVIPKVGFDNNTTHSMKFKTFSDVVRHGPFIDLYFGAGSAHGQEAHLIQMDFAESVLTNRQAFWEYATTLGKGDYVWDTLFDGTNGTYMHPEKIGPILRQTLPLK